jgi:hypothetical protein
MLTALLLPIAPEIAGVQYRPQPAIHQRALAGDRPWPLREVGTGGVAMVSFIREAYGYPLFTVLQSTTFVPEAPFVKLMQQVKAGFGRTLSRLPVVFGVSRQTLYNWLEGETPKPAHHERLRQLAEAAAVFQEFGIKPTTPMLERTLAQGKNFLQLLAEGTNGKDAAKKLVRVVQRGNESRSKLDALLGGRKATLTSSDLGAPALDENV